MSVGGTNSAHQFLQYSSGYCCSDYNFGLTSLRATSQTALLKSGIHRIITSRGVCSNLKYLSAIGWNHYLRRVAGKGQVTRNRLDDNCSPLIVLPGKPGARRSLRISALAVNFRDDQSLR